MKSSYVQKTRVRRPKGRALDIVLHLCLCCCVMEKMDPNALVANRRKRNTPKKIQRITEQCSGVSICVNPACRAVVSVFHKFCTRCSCCICKDFDGNKDPTLWFECSPDSPERSCGSSCHIKCALEKRKIGVVEVCQMLRLDGGYSCSYCGNISGILGCLKKQLTLAKETRRADVLCDRINLSFKLLNGTSRFQDLLEIIKDAKSKLESEVGSLDGLSSELEHCLARRFSVAAEVQKLCTAAVQKANELSATPPVASVEGEDLWMPDQMVSPGTLKADGSQSTSRRLDLNVVAEPELDENVAPAADSSMPAFGLQAEVVRERPSTAEVHGELNENFEQGPDEEMPDVSFQAEVTREALAPAATETRGDLDDNYEYCLEVIRGLECDNHITSEVRQNLFTWFSLMSDEHQRGVVYTFINAFVGDSRALAEQLADTFGDAI